MRSLNTDAPVEEKNGAAVQAGIRAERDECFRFTEKLRAMKKQHHSRCCFNRGETWLPQMDVEFDNEGVLHGTFTAGDEHQGYDGRAHGGIVAALVDSSMAQCCMGHGVAGYTADLSVRYRKPVQIGIPVSVTTSITGIRAKVLYTVTSHLSQDGREVAACSGKFYRFA